MDALARNIPIYIDPATKSGGAVWIAAVVVVLIAVWAVSRATRR